jgi:hypothetical protein
MFRVASTAASAVFSILYASGLMKNGTNTTPIDVTPLHKASECEWYTPDMGILEELPCAAIDLRRATGAELYTALDKAERCARASGETCLLSHEVGLSVPAVFVYNASLAQMRAILVPSADRAYFDEQPKARVLVGDPLEATMQSGDIRAKDYIFAKSIKVKFLGAASGMGLRDEYTTLEDTEAYCVQLLNSTLNDACKAEFMM